MTYLLSACFHVYIQKLAYRTLAEVKIHSNGIFDNNDAYYCLKRCIIHSVYSICSMLVFQTCDVKDYIQKEILAYC